MEFFRNNDSQNAGTLDFVDIFIHPDGEEDAIVFVRKPHNTQAGFSDDFPEYIGLSPLVVFNLLEDTKLSYRCDIHSCRAADLDYLTAYTPGKSRIQKAEEVEALLRTRPLTQKDLTQTQWDNGIYEKTGDLPLRMSAQERQQRCEQAAADLRAEGFDLRVSYCLGEIGHGLLRQVAITQAMPRDFKAGALQEAWNAYLAHNPSYGQEKPVAPSPSVKPPRHNGP